MDLAKKLLFKQLIQDFTEKSLDHVIDRSIDLPEDVQKVISVIGPRRAGKTFVLYSLIKKLRRKLPITRLVYINFEDDRLYPLQLADLDDFIVGYYELYPENKDFPVYFFFDEVQEVSNWEKFIRRINDQENCRIYLTGSSSKLLTHEIATSLRGRTITYEVLPLSFKEFLNFQGVKANPGSTKGKARLAKALSDYFKQGGFPELIFNPAAIHQRIVQEYLDIMIYRDLSERYSVRNPALVKYLLKYLLQNLANPLSFNKVYNDLHSQGLKVARNSVYEYFGYLEETFTLFKTQIYSHSIRKQSSNPSKIYSVDLAFARAMNHRIDQGRLFENFVFLHLRRAGLHPNYFLDKQEVDFYVEDRYLINACISMEDYSTRTREVEGLKLAMQKTAMRESYLITWDEEGELDVGSGIIHMLPLWRWLLMEIE